MGDSSNIKPAPVFMSPTTIAAVVGDRHGPAPQLAEVPLMPTKLVDRPRRSEDPYFARANDNHEALPRHDFDLRIRRCNNCGCGVEDVEDGLVPLTCGNKPAADQSRPVARIRITMDARQCGKTARLEMMRAIARRLEQGGAAKGLARIMPGKPQAAKAAIPSNPYEQRRRDLVAAIAFLKARCILVSISDRNAQITKYRVSGRREPLLGCEVVEMAAMLGFVRGES